MIFTHAFIGYHPCGKCVSGFMADEGDGNFSADDAEWFAFYARKGRKVEWVPAERASIGECECPTVSASGGQS